MGFIPRKNETTDGVSNDTFNDLRTKIEDSRKDLLRVQVQKRAGRGGWKRTGIVIDVIPESEDGRELDSDGLANALLTMTLEDAEVAGKEQMYSFEGYVRSRGRNGETKGWSCIAKLGPDGDEDDVSPAVDVVKLVQVSKQMLSDTHARNLELLDKTIALAGSVTKIATETADAASKNNATLIEAMRMQMEFEERKHEREGDMFFAERNGKIFEKVIDTMGKPFADRFSQVFGDAAEKHFGFTRGDLAKRLGTLLEGLTTEQRTEFERTVGSDGWETLQACAKAKDDEQFRAVFQRVIDHWSKDRDAANKQLQQLAKILGVKVAGFFQLLKDIGIEEG